MLKVGITGGIGSGKSTIAKIFATLGIPVFNADAEAKKIMETNNEIREKIIETFGANTYSNKQLNRKVLANIVFNNEYELGRLNNIVHPIIFEETDKWIAQQNAPYIVKEAAIMFESGSAQKVDVVVGVYAPKHLRIKRVLDREKEITRDEIIGRMSNQINEELKMKLCNFVIINNEEQLVIPQVLHLHNLFLAK